MCIIAGMFGASAAAAASAQAIAGLVISAAGTAAGIAQQQQQLQYQHAMTMQQQTMQSQNQQRQVAAERQAQMLRHIGEVKAQQEQTLAYNRQIFNNNEAANRVFSAEQIKLNEARNKAAFKGQEIYAKAIGAQGKVLASGATGQSVGLLALDANRQAGFANAELNASMRSAEGAAANAMLGASLENESANNMALSKLPGPVQAPQFSPDISGIGIGALGIPSYNWGRY